MKKSFWLFLVYSLGASAQQWSEVGDMVPADADFSDYGVNMVFTDQHLVVSWPKTFVQGGPPEDCGEVITYQKIGDQYEELHRLTAADLTGDCVAGDGFGYGLAFDQGRLAIGMPAGARAGTNLPGGGSDTDSRVFITTWENGQWQLTETLVADDLAVGRGMGFQLVMENDLLLVHAHEYDSIFGVAFPISTGVYVFKDTGSGFVQQQKLTENHHLFGQDFDTENGQIVVGAWGEQTIGAPGKVYVYEELGGTWTLVQTINDGRNKNLGNQIEIHGDMLVAGSVHAGGTGAVVVFKRDQGQWIESQFIQASDLAVNDQFGIAVRVDEDDLVVGASAGTNQVQTVGAVYHFTKNGNGLFIEQQKIESPKDNEAADQFGANLIFNDTDLLINEPSGRNLAGSVTNFWHFNRAGSTPTVAAIGAQTSGVWQVPGLEGQSVNIDVLSDTSALMFINHADANGSSWWYAVGEIDEDQITFDALLSASGPNFGDQFNPADLVIETIGQAVFQLNACDAGQIQWQINGQPSQQHDLVKSRAVSDLACQSNTKALQNGISGSWFTPARTGEGFSVYTHGSGANQTASVYWYTYDNNGQAMTLVGQGPVNDAMITIDELKHYGAGEPFTQSASAMVVGSLELLWEGCSEAFYQYDLSSSGLGTGAFELTQLTRVKDSSCQ